MQTFRFLNKAISGSVFYNRSHKLNHHDGDSCLLCFQISLCHCIEVVNKVLTKCFILQRYQLYNQCNLGIVFMIITTSQSNIAVIQCLECMLLMLWILLCIEVVNKLLYWGSVSFYRDTNFLNNEISEYLLKS